MNIFLQIIKTIFAAFDIQVILANLMSFLEGILIFLLGIILVKLKAFRAGDAKLLAVITMYLGIRKTFILTISSLLAGVIIGFIEISTKRARKLNQLELTNERKIQLHGFHFTYAILLAFILI